MMGVHLHEAKQDEINWETARLLAARLDKLVEKIEERTREDVSDGTISGGRAILRGKVAARLEAAQAALLSACINVGVHLNDEGADVASERDWTKTALDPKED